jgi:3-dehydroquinate dehydratase type I
MDFEECLQYAAREAMVEFRFDLLDVGPSRVISLVGRARRCIATCRQGGMNQENRFLLLQTALEAGSDYIDLDMETDLEMMKELLPTARSKSCDLILSYHDFDKTPQAGELEDIVKKALDMGADVVKLACQVNRTDDIINLLGLYRLKCRKVILGMGAKGVITRVAAPLLGAEFTFASAGEGMETAPGQISKEKLIDMLKDLNFEQNKHLER